MSIKGRFTLTGRTKGGVLVARRAFDNLLTTEGINAILDGYFGGTCLSALYVGLIGGVSYTAIAASDTAAQINGTNGWKEGSDATNTPAYSEAFRPTLTLGAAASGIRISSAATFTITTDGTIKGLFTISENTKAGVIGTLVSAGLLPDGDQAVVASQVWTATWQVSI